MRYACPICGMDVKDPEHRAQDCESIRQTTVDLLKAQAESPPVLRLRACGTSEGLSIKPGGFFARMLRRENKSKERGSMPEPAPEIVMAANGVYWRRYPEYLSMVPVSDDNDPVVGPLAVYKLVGYEDHEGTLHSDGPCDSCGSFDHTPARCPTRRFA